MPASSAEVTWLRCQITPGMFEHEVGVEGRQFDDAVFSLFAPKKWAVYDPAELAAKRQVPGWIHVEVMDRRDDIVLVQLPRQTFQDGAYVTVRADQLESSPQLQHA